MPDARRHGLHQFFDRGAARALVVVAACGGLIACGKQRSKADGLVRLPEPAVRTPTSGATADTTAIEWTLLIGQASVMRADPATLASIAASGRTSTRLADGTTLTIRPHALRVSPGDPVGDPTSALARMGKWLSVHSAGRVQLWSSEPATESAIANTATVVLIEPQGGRAAPAATSDGLLSTRSLSIRWLPPAPRDLPARLHEVFHRPLRESAHDSVWVRAAIAAARSSPLTRWRSRLADGTLFAPGNDRFDDPVVEALARTVEAQWAHALVSVAEANPLVARRLVEELCTVADFGGGVIVPAWEPESSPLASLLESLLDPAPATPVEAANAWLGARSSIYCWVADDAGASDPATGHPVGTFLVANLGTSPVAAWTGGIAARAGAEIVAVPPRSVRTVPALQPDSNGASRIADDAIRGVLSELQAGEQSFLRTLHSAPIPAQAPGVVIAPFHADWSLAEWRAAGLDAQAASRFGPWSAPPPADAAWRTSGLVYRGIDTPLEQGAALPDRWLLYLEMSEPADARGDAESLRVWCGALGKSRVVLRVYPDGRVIDDSPPAATPQRDLPRLVRTARTASGWTCWIPIPPSAFDPDGTLRLGVERTDRRGVRTTWPRPSLPWQQEPARILIDPTRWAGAAP